MTNLPSQSDKSLAAGLRLRDRIPMESGSVYPVNED